MSGPWEDFQQKESKGPWEDFAQQQPSQSGVQLLNKTESLQTPMVALEGGFQSLMLPPQFAKLDQQPVVNQPPIQRYDDPAVRAQQYGVLNARRQQIEAEYAQANAAVHEYPFLRWLQQKMVTNPDTGTGRVDPSKSKPIFPVDPEQERIVQENELERQRKLAELAVVSKEFGFDKIPGTEFPDVFQPLQQFGIRANTVQKALGTGETTSKIVAGLQQAAAGVPEVLTSPFGLVTMPLMTESIVGKQVTKQAGRVFVGDMVTHLPEQALAAKQAFEEGDVEGAIKALAGIALTTTLAGREIKGAMPGLADKFKGANAKWEVVPKEPIGPSRQLGEAPPIDIQAEVQMPPQLPQPRRFYQSESKNPPVDARQLTRKELDARLAIAKQYEAPQPKKTYQGEVEIIGRNEPVNIAKELGVRYDGQQQLHPALPVKDVYTSLDPKNPFTVYVDAGAKISDVASRLAEKRQQDVQLQPQQPAGQLVKPELPSKPVEQPTGGQISFASAAGQASIPNARQSALQDSSIAPALPSSKPLEQSFSFGREKIAEAESKSPISDTSKAENLSSQKAKPAESRSINEQDIGYRNTGAVTKQQQEWIMSSAKKLLRSPEQLRYAPDRKGEFDAGQLVNRLMNNIPKVEQEMLSQAGIKEKFKPGQKVTKEEVEKWIDENGPRVEVQSYGMEGKVSEAKREYDRMTHEWRDSLPEKEAQDLHIVLGRHPEVVEQYLTGKWKPEEVAKAKRYAELNQQIINEPHDTSPRATSAYDTVSALPTNEPMPEWTTSKEGKNAQRVDVVIPYKWRETYNERTLKLTGKEVINELWTPDNLHENLPNTLGWAMIQYKTGPKGEKIAFIAEAQSRWGQRRREANQLLKSKEAALREKEIVQLHKGTLNRNNGLTNVVLGQDRQTVVKVPDEVAAKLQVGGKMSDEAIQIAMKHYEEIGTRIKDAPDHPLLRDYNRLILKAAIEQARKEGAEYIAISDSKSALMSETLDTQYQKYPNKEAAEQAAEKQRTATENYQAVEHGGEWYVTKHEKGFDFNYDVSMPKITEELTGSKGEKVSLGEHKNAFLYSAEERATRQDIDNTPRKDLIFRNADGTPKTDVSVTLFPLNKVAAAQERSPFTLTGADRLKETKGPEGQTIYFHSGIPLSPETLKNIRDWSKQGFAQGRFLLRAYAEPMVHSLERGGPVSKQFSKEARQIVSDTKSAYGKLTPVLDTAKKAVGGHESQAFEPNRFAQTTGITTKGISEPATWLRELNTLPNRKNLAYNNFFGVNEGVVTPPRDAQSAIAKSNRANLAIGELAAEANPDFTPTGFLQRLPTGMQYDMIKQGWENSPLLREWGHGVAELNGQPVEGVKNYLKQYKAILDNPASNLVKLDKISQDFKRRYPRTITHIKDKGVWHELVIADPFNYLEAAAQRTAASVAFRKVFQPDSGLLADTRKKIQAELDTTGMKAEQFDDLIRVLQGHPLDHFTKWWNAPDKPVGAVARLADETVLAPMRAMMLSANFITNLGETVAGGQYAMFGVKNTLQGMARHLKEGRQVYDDMQILGTVNEVIKNFAADPNQPVRSAARIGVNVFRSSFFEQLLNEVQETTAASGAQVLSERLIKGEVKGFELGEMKATARAMRFTKPEIDSMVRGDIELLLQFMRRASAESTAGYQLAAERSRAGASRFFNKVLPFHSYVMTVYNQFRSVGSNIGKAAKEFINDPTKENLSTLGHDAFLFAKLLGFRGLQGALTKVIVGLVTGGLYGWLQTKRDAKEDPIGFVKDSLSLAIGGPLVVLNDVAQKSSDSKSLTANLTSVSATFSTSAEALDAARGVGKYQGWEPKERLGMFFEARMPGWRLIKTGLAAVELAEDVDMEYKVARNNFYKWAREQEGYVQPSFGARPEEDARFTAQMKRVVMAMERGQDWRSELAKVENLKKGSQSLRGLTLLEFNNKALTDEQKESLQKRIGEKAYGRLQTRDAMIRELAREVGELSKTEGTVADIPEPTGRFATDATTSTQRKDAVASKVEPSIIKLLQVNKLEFPSYEAEVKEWGQKEKRQLTKEEAAMYEPLLVEEYNRRLAPYLDNEGFNARPLLWRQKKIQERMAKAREVAQVRLRAKLRQGQ